MEIRLNGLEIQSNHGVFPEEAILGGRYVTNAVVVLDDVVGVISDQLNDTLDYQHLAVIVTEEMAIRSQLLEHVAGRICDRIKRIPRVASIELEIIKKNPPLGYSCESTSVKMSYSRQA